jgi:hypothetical protein
LQTNVAVAAAIPLCAQLAYWLAGNDTQRQYQIVCDPQVMHATINRFMRVSRGARYSPREFPADYFKSNEKNEKVWIMLLNSSFAARAGNRRPILGQRIARRLYAISNSLTSPARQLIEFLTTSEYR